MFGFEELRASFAVQAEVSIAARHDVWTTDKFNEPRPVLRHKFEIEFLLPHREERQHRVGEELASKLLRILVCNPLQFLQHVWRDTEAPRNLRDLMATFRRCDHLLLITHGIL